MFGTTLIFAASSIFALSLAAPLRIHAVTPNTLVARGTYVMFGGDGSMNAGFPKRSEWLPFEQAWDANLDVIQQGCAWNGWGANNDDTETQAIKDSIEEESDASGIPKELILAVVIQESRGCVRVATNAGNPGLMQSAGQTSCSAISPCPADKIRAMIHEGTAGEGLRTTLKKELDYFEAKGISDDSKWYKAARRYNAGEIQMDESNLGVGPTPCYTSDITNRLVQPFDVTACKDDIIPTLKSAQGRISTTNNNPDESIEVKEKQVENKEPPPTSQQPEPEVHETVVAQKEATVDNDDTKNKDQSDDAKPSDPVIPGAASGCTKYYTPRKGDGCASAPIDFTTLRQLNSDLNDKCTNLWTGYAYCIAA